MNKSRLNFTKGLVLGSVAVVMGGCAKDDPYDVVIIGAGISRLNTALQLQDLGLKVIVLEAGDRVGGRIETVITEYGPLDVGASQIGLGYARVLSACESLGLKLIPEDRDLLDFGMHFKNQWIDIKTWSDNPLNECKGDERKISPMMMGRSIVKNEEHTRRSEFGMEAAMESSDRVSAEILSLI